MKINPIMMKTMKKMMLFKAAMAALLSFAVFACTPVEPEGNGGENPGGENPGGGEPDTPIVVERSIKLYNADAEVETLVFAADATTYELTVKANFQWDLDKDATTWPAWLKKLTASATGVLNETSELYEGTVTLVLNVANISSYYENKTGNLVFTDVEDLEYAYEFPVSHTFEKPVEPESILSNALGTNIITVTTDGKIKGTDSNKLEITITPGEGQTDFIGFPVAYIDYPPYDQSSFEWTPCVDAVAGSNSNYKSGHWVSLVEESGKYTLTVHNYPEPYEPAAGAGLRHTHKALLFVFPSSVHGSFPGMGGKAGNDPNAVWWWMMSKNVFMDDSQYPVYTVREDYQKYVITLNVEQPAE
jgi:hypothetical protein